MDEAAIAGLELPGVRPGLQRRSRETAARLLAAGVDLLATSDFADLSVERICAEADVTVGSFYARFDGRDAYIAALKHVVFEQARWQIEAFHAGDAPMDTLESFLTFVVRATLGWYRAHEGFLRAMLRQAGQSPESWAPLRELGRLQVDRALPRIARIRGRNRKAERDARLAFQILHGALNNMAQIDPGPLRLHDRSATRQLATLMVRMIDG